MRILLCELSELEISKLVTLLETSSELAVHEKGQLCTDLYRKIIAI
jgi:hypothetical protein